MNAQEAGMDGKPKVPRLASLDIERAVAEVHRAESALARIAMLPREDGARVKWHVNGMVWQRIGGDEWRPVGPEAAYFAGYETWPSSHIASEHGWDRIEQ